MTEDRLKTKRYTPALMSRRRGRLNAIHLTVLVLLQVMLLNNAALAAESDCLAPALEMDKLRFEIKFSEYVDAYAEYDYKKTPFYAFGLPDPAAQGGLDYKRPVAEKGLLEIAEIFNDRAPYVFSAFIANGYKVELASSDSQYAVRHEGKTVFLHPGLFDETSSLSHLTKEHHYRLFLLLFYEMTRIQTEEFFKGRGQPTMSKMVHDLFFGTWLRQEAVFFFNLNAVLAVSCRGRPNFLLWQKDMEDKFRAAFELVQMPVGVPDILAEKVNCVARMRAVEMDNTACWKVQKMYEKFMYEFCSRELDGCLLDLIVPGKSEVEYDIIKHRRLRNLASLIVAEPLISIDTDSVFEVGISRTENKQRRRELSVMKTTLDLARDLSMNWQQYVHILSGHHYSNPEDYFLINGILKENVGPFLCKFLRGIPIRGIHIMFSGNIARGNCVFGSDDDFYIVVDDGVLLSSEDKRLLLNALNKIKMTVNPEGAFVRSINRDRPFSPIRDAFITRSELRKNIQSGAAGRTAGDIKEQSLADIWAVSLDDSFVRELAGLREKFFGDNSEFLRMKILRLIESEVLRYSNIEEEEFDLMSLTNVSATLNSVVYAMRLANKMEIYTERYGVDDVLNDLYKRDMLTEDETKQIEECYDLFGTVGFHVNSFMRMNKITNLKGRESEVWAYLGLRFNRSVEDLQQEIINKQQWIRDFALDRLPGIVFKPGIVDLIKELDAGHFAESSI
ncbi:MAG: hypothetical protein ABII88_09040 [Candidatus Omnitrophota bacterium]